MVKFRGHQALSGVSASWSNPVDGKVYSTTGQPDHGFSSEIGAHAIYDMNVYHNNVAAISKAAMAGELTQDMVEKLQTPILDGDLAADIEEYESLIKNGKMREAAMLSSDNTQVNAVIVHAKTYGLTDRNYAGIELAERAPTEELILNFDKVIKMNGMEEIPENTIPRIKNIEYERVTLETKKYGLATRITDESIRKNFHNPAQDSLTVTGTKAIQRKSFDIIAALEAELTSVVAPPIDTFILGVNRSTNDPGFFMGNIQSNIIEGTNVGGLFSHYGTNQLGQRRYNTNTYVNGNNEKAPDANFAPGTMPLAGFNGKTLVQDQFIPQGVAYMVDVGNQSTCILLEGPMLVTSKIDELTLTQTHAIMSHHLARVLNPSTGRRLTGLYTPVAAV